MAKRIIRLTETELAGAILKSMLGSDPDKYVDNLLGYLGGAKQKTTPLTGSSDSSTSTKSTTSAGTSSQTTGSNKTDSLKPLETGKLKPITSLKGNLRNMDFYQSLLKKLNAPVTAENLKFLYAWRQSEGNGGKYNPFNTTLKKPGSKFFNFLNSKKTMGVQSYPNNEIGLEATVDTLKHKRYSCITDGLRKDIGAAEIASKCSSALKTWGTGDLISKVIAGYDRGASIKVKDIA